MVRQPPANGNQKRAKDRTLRLEWRSRIRMGQFSTLGNVDVRRLVSPDLNAELLMDLRALQWLAGELGRPEEVRAWREQAETLSRNMVQGLYDSEDGLFYDVHIDDGYFSIGSREPVSSRFGPAFLWIPRGSSK